MNAYFSRIGRKIHFFEPYSQEFGAFAVIIDVTKDEQTGNIIYYIFSSLDNHEDGAVFFPLTWDELNKFGKVY